MGKYVVIYQSFIEEMKKEENPHSVNTFPTSGAALSPVHVVPTGPREVGVRIDSGKNKFEAQKKNTQFAKVSG